MSGILKLVIIAKKCKQLIQFINFVSGKLKRSNSQETRTAISNHLLNGIFTMDALLAPLQDIVEGQIVRISFYPIKKKKRLTD